MNDKPGWGRRGEGYVAIQFVLFGLILLSPSKLPETTGWPNPWHTPGIGLGVALGLAGGLLALAGVLSLGRNLTAVPYPKEDAALVEAGAFRIVRHPIYSGILLGSIGWGFLNSSVIALFFALVLFIFFDVKSRREEQWLNEKYPGYVDYQMRVRKLIPLIY